MQTNNETFLGSPDNPKTAGVVCYITLIGWLIAYFALYKKGSSYFAAFHLRQTLLLHIIAFIMNILAFLSLWHLFPEIVVWILSGILFILWVVGLFNAASEKTKPLPVIGNVAQRMFKNL